jgi:hypothetical protein
MKRGLQISSARLITTLVVLQFAARAQVTLVNMTPVNRSGETNQDAETCLAVNPNNPLQIAGTAFTWDNLTGPPATMVGALAPIYVSIDGGQTWNLVKNVPSTAGSQFPTGDITVHFSGTPSGDTNVLYAGILHAPDFNMNVLRSTDFRVDLSSMTLLDTRTDNVDQPHIDAATPLRGDTGKDRVYVGFNNGYSGVHSQTATVDYSLDAGIASPVFNLALIESRSTGTGGQDGFANMPAIHLDGTIYVAFYGWRSSTTTDLVVVRDDNWATGATPFTALTDPVDTLVGSRVVTGVNKGFGSIGQERVASSNISIAVDPRDSDRVYVAWLDMQSSTPTLHVRRSIDRGVHWSASDLITESNAVNPALAINSMGKVGFLYQRLTGAAGSQRWETHFTRTTDADATTFDDPGLTLANADAATPSMTFTPYLGDYDYLRAVGQNFYGIFTASNYPDHANFYPGVIYQRYVNWSTHTLYADAAMTTTVAVSIDPFFFQVNEVAPGDDFYVRDWTNSASDADNGAQPSTNPVFYTTSDVWNRRGTLPGSFPSDQPENEDAGNGTGSFGDNWAFARIRRNAASTDSQTVSAHFLVSEFGTGSAYMDSTTGDPDFTFDATDPTVTFSPGDLGPQITPPYHWHLNASASTHLCLAVEITGPRDPYIPPSLVGNTPGWPTTDLRIVNDNNKAQRNMGLSTTPARGVGASPSGSVSYCGIVHNAATYPRDVTLGYHADPSTLRRLRNASIEVIGQPAIPFQPDGALTLTRLQPGENRWVCANFIPPKGAEGEVLALNFSEMVNGTAVNGFAIGARLASDDRVIADVLALHRSEFARLARLFDSEHAGAEAQAVQKLIDAKQFTRAAYSGWLNLHLPEIERLVHDRVEAEKVQDPLNLIKALSTLRAAAKTRNTGRTAMAHTAFLQRLDSFLTMRRLARGNPGDILQNVRWQNDLYSKTPQLSSLGCSAELRQKSAEFIRAYGTPKGGNREFPALMRQLHECFEQTSRQNRQLDLDKLVDRIEDARELAALENAHREYLLKLQTLVP